MKKAFDKYIIRKHQRYLVSTNLFDKIIVRLSNKYYQSLFVNHKNRSELSNNLWGGEGGYLHAKNQFERDDWMRVYGDFFRLVHDEIKQNIQILEIGCSMGQWVKRLELDLKNVNYTEIDINPKSIEAASAIFKNNKNIKFECIDLNNGYELNNYNLIICVQVLFFLDLELIKNIFNQITIGTKIVISEPINKNQNNLTEQLKSNNSVGFSHNYNLLMTHLGYELTESKIEKTSRNGYRIHAKYIKVN